MPTPATLTVGNWNQLVQTLADESDRGAAILAASFVENFLGNFLKSKIHDDAVAKALFGPVGPLSSFSQRIVVAYAFSFIERDLYDDLTAIREIRNYFAHRPFDASFEVDKVQRLVSGLRAFQHSGLEFTGDTRLRHRMPYLATCGLTCCALESAMNQSISDVVNDG